MPFKFSVEGPDLNEIGRLPKALIDAMDDAVEDEVVEEERAMAEEFRQDLIRHIESGLLQLPALSEGYLDYKIRTGLDHRILIATKAYINAIQVIDTPDGAGVGMAKGNHPSGIPYEILADLLEYGSGTMKWGLSGHGAPPRPHWRPVREKWSVNGRETTKRIDKALYKGVMNKLKTELPTLFGDWKFQGE